VRRKALRAAARTVEHRLNADTSDHLGPTALCACGQPARYAGRRPKTFDSVLGPLTLERAYYHCEPCAAGFCPRDRALGLEGGSLTPGVLRMVGRVGAMVSFEEGHELLRELAGVDVTTKHVERAAEALGREVAEDERRVVEPPPVDEPIAPTLYLGMDGTGVPVRKEELEARPGKQPDGSAKTREVKLATVWSAEGRDEHGLPERDAGSIRYSAAIESAASRDTDPQPADFAQRALREATRRGFQKAERRVVLGDGALWIWNVADEHFPGAIQIVDLYHATGHFRDVAQGHLRRRQRPRRTVGQESPRSTRGGATMSWPRSPSMPGSTKRRASASTTCAHPPQPRCVGSGVVESGCKKVSVRPPTS
jgi:hypothetical protein